MRQKSLIPLDEIPQTTKSPSTPILRVNHTRDTLTVCYFVFRNVTICSESLVQALHAYHIRLSRIVQRGPKDADIESRLREIVARSLGSGMDARVGDYVYVYLSRCVQCEVMLMVIRDKCTKVARLRARKRVQFRPIATAPVMHPGDIVRVTVRFCSLCVCLKYLRTRLMDTEGEAEGAPEPQ
jgi:hypothetical protein